MGFSVIRKKGKSIEISDLNSNGRVVSGSSQIFNYNEGINDWMVYDAWRSTNASGGYSTKITNATHNVGNDGRVRQHSKITREGVSRGGIDETGGMSNVGSAKIVPAPVVVPSEPPQDMGQYLPPDQPMPEPLAKLVPQEPVKEEPAPVVPQEPIENPAADLLWHDKIKTIEDLKAAFDSQTITDRQVEGWLRMNGMDHQSVGWTGESFATVPIDTSIPNQTPTTTVGLGIGDDGMLNSKGETVFSTGSYSQVPWNPIYRQYLNNNFGGGSNPLVRGFMKDQGMSNDPMQRTAYTQFLLQATEDDIWAGNTQGGVQPSGRAYGGLSADPKANPYAEFLDNYRPLESGTLISTIGEVIDTLKVPESSWESFDTGKDEKGVYTDENLRNFRWRDRFGEGSKADQNQQALAALPIMQSTPAPLRNETGQILRRMHDMWMANPNRDANEGWLEFVDRNNYFGMMGSYQPVSGEIDPSAGGDIG